MSEACAHGQDPDPLQKQEAMIAGDATMPAIGGKGGQTLTGAGAGVDTGVGARTET